MCKIKSAISFYTAAEWKLDSRGVRHMNKALALESDGGFRHHSWISMAL